MNASVLLATVAAPSVSIEIGAVAGWLLGVISTLLVIIGWFLKRELGRINAVEADVKLLLSGEAPWVKGMRLEIVNLRDEMAKLYRLLLQERSDGQVP